MAANEPIECPVCGTPHPHPEPVPADRDRCHAKLLPCDCGAYLRLMTVEGWGRWYFIDWRPNEADDAVPTDDRAAFFARIKDRDHGCGGQHA